MGLPDGRSPTSLPRPTSERHKPRPTRQRTAGSSQPDLYRTAGGHSSVIAENGAPPGAVPATARSAGRPPTEPQTNLQRDPVGLSEEQLDGSFSVRERRPGLGMHRFLVDSPPMSPRPLGAYEDGHRYGIDRECSVDIPAGTPIVPHGDATPFRLVDIHGNVLGYYRSGPEGQAALRRTQRAGTICRLLSGRSRK